MKYLYFWRFFMWSLIMATPLGAAPELPIRAEQGLTQTQLAAIYLEVKDLSDGIQICTVLDRYGWFVESTAEGSHTRNPYISYKEQKDRLEKLYSQMSPREFSINLAFFEDTIRRANLRGLKEKDRIAKLLNQ